MRRHTRQTLGDKRGRLLVVPRALRKDILQEAHGCADEGQHAGVRKMLRSIRRRYYWYGYAFDMRRWCRPSINCTPVKCNEKGRQLVVGRTNEGVYSCGNLVWMRPTDNNKLKGPFVVLDRLNGHKCRLQKEAGTEPIVVDEMQVMPYN